MRITCLNHELLTDMLDTYQLKVEKLSTNTHEALVASDITLLHYKGWHDKEVPKTEAEITGL